MPSISIELLNKIDACQVCPTMGEYENFHNNSHGNLSSSYMLVSEAPGKDSIDAEQYWTGQSGRLLRSAASQANCELEALFYLTDIVKCWPSNDKGKNRTPTDEETANCAPHLDEEIKELQPKLIVAFGAKVSEYLLNRKKIRIGDIHGSIFAARGTRILTLIHPAGVDRHPDMNRQLYIQQLVSLFDLLQKDDVDNVEAIFLEDNVGSVVQDYPWPTSGEAETATGGESFIMPVPGNSITAKDIYKDQIRITVAFKRFFPSEDCTLTVQIGGQSYRTRLRYRDGRSYIWKLGHRAMRALNLKAGDRVMVQKSSDQQFRLSKYEG